MTKESSERSAEMSDRAAGGVEVDVGVGWLLWWGGAWAGVGVCGGPPSVPEPEKGKSTRGEGYGGMGEDKGVDKGSHVREKAYPQGLWGWGGYRAS